MENTNEINLSNVEGVSREELVIALAEAKAAKGNADVLKNLAGSFETAVETFSKAVNELAVDNRNRQESEALENIDAKLVDTFKSLDKSDPKREEIKNLIAKEAGWFNTELALGKGEFAKTLARPVYSGTANREEILDTKKAWDRTLILTAMYGGIQGGSTDSANPRIDKGLLNQAITVLSKDPFNATGMENVRKGVDEALDTATATEGLEWIPTNLSSRLLDDVWLSLQLEGLFARYPMSSPTFKMPIRTGRSRGYRVAQATTNAQFFTNLFTAHNLETGAITFEADKLGVLNFISDELEQDSVVPIIDLVSSDIVWGMADAIEDAVLNGSTGTTDLDNADASANNRLWSWGGSGGNPSGYQVQAGTADARNAWNGIRKSIASGQKINGSTLSLASIRNARKTMGKYGVNPSELVLIVAPETMINMLSFPELITVDKYGANATVITGEIGRIDNIRVVVSPRVYTYLNASGAFDNATYTKTALYLVNTKGFAFGDRRTMRVETDRNILAGQRAIVASARMDFQKLFASGETLAAEIYNVTV